MSVSLLKFLLWIPFGIVVIIAGAIFLTSGYKRGLWRALISMGATVVATLISMLIANLLSKPIANSVYNALFATATEGSAVSAEIMMPLVKGLIGVVLSLVLFSVLLLVFSIVLKCVSNRIHSEKLDVDKKSLKWAGLGVRVVDTVLFALLLMLPLYGTMATYVPAAQTVVQMQKTQSSETEAYLEAVVSHPVVQMSGNGPAAWVYTGLSDVQTNEGSVNVAEMAQTVEGLVTRAEAITVASPDQVPAMTQELVQYTRKNVIEQPWCYDLVQELLGMVETSMRQGITQEDQGQVDTFLQLFEMSREEFKENGIHLLDFVSYMLETGVLENEQKAEQVMKSEDFLSRLGEFLNCTDQAVAAKNLMLRMMIQEQLFDADEEAAATFLVGRLSDQPTAKELQAQEAAAFMQLMEAGSWEEQVSALEQIPSLNFEAEDREEIPQPTEFDMEDFYGEIVAPDADGNFSVGIIYGDEESDVPEYTVVYKGE